MARPVLLKTSPLFGLYRQFPVQTEIVSGWQIAQHFGNPQREKQQLRTGSVLVDWSHLGKLSVSGRGAAAAVEAVLLGAAGIKPLSSIATSERAALRLTLNDYLILCLPGQEDALLATLANFPATVINRSGALGCFALAGPRRDEVWERSTALDLRRDRFLPGAVAQTTLHTIRCTLWRRQALEIIVHPSSLSESLFQALIDVGMGVGLVPSGIVTLPVILLS